MPRLVISILRVFTGVALLSVVITVLASVAIRYLGLFDGSLHWVDEAARFSVIWLVMLGCVLACDEGAHMSVDLVPGRASDWIRAMIGTTGRLLTFAFLLVLAFFGFRLSLATLNQFSPALGVPMGLVYLAVPVGAALMSWQYAIELRNRFTHPHSRPRSA